MAGEKFEHAEQKQVANALDREDPFQQVIAEVWAAPGAYRHIEKPQIDRSTIEFKDDGKVVFSNADGRITKVEEPSGTVFDYSYDKNGKLTGATITGKDGDSDYWVKDRDGKWRSYDEYHGPGDKRNKPGSLQLKGGDWEIDKGGRMYHSSGEVVHVPEH